MRATSRPDLEIAGIGSAAGGQYHSVKMEGVCKVGDAIDCFAFKSNGLTTVNGGIMAEEQLEVSGKLSCHGGMVGGNVKLEGQVTVNGPFEADRAEMNGLVKVKGDADASDFKVRGALSVEGWLTAGQLEVKLEGPFHAEGIKSRHITVRHHGKGGLRRLIESLLPVWQVQLKARTIEGDIVDVEETTAELVRGRTVVIGPGSDIDRVEYVTDLVVHPQAQVRSRLQIQG